MTGRSGRGSSSHLVRGTLIVRGDADNGVRGRRGGAGEGPPEPRICGVRRLSRLRQARGPLFGGDHHEREFKLANKTVPITKPVILQGGIIEGSHVLVPAAEGNTLSRTPFTVPGGLTGIEALPLGEVIAVTELAGPVEVFEENLSDGRGPSVKLPVKVKLENSVLGEECYVGSDAEPILLQLTTGTTKPPAGTEPITGKAGTVSLDPSLTILTITGSSLVDNTFTAPGVSGCGGALSSCSTRWSISRSACRPPREPAGPC